MLINDVHPTTLVGVKRLAKHFKKTKGIRHSDALKLAAQSAYCKSFTHAQRTLPMNGTSLPRPYVLLTIYWSDKDSRPRCGRETLRIELSMPILALCEKSALRYVRGFGNLRLVARDHFVCDDIAQNQEFARSRLCTAERSLRFMEHTGLRPYRNCPIYPTVLNNDKLPNRDHSTDWIDQDSGQFVLVDEPYGNAPDTEERAAWALRTGWRLAQTSWPGMYSPYKCDLYVGVDQGSGYDLDALIERIDAMPDPVVSGNWSGDSVSSWETFLSPMAETRQDERRARCKGMIYPSPSKSTAPYNYNLGCSRRRPIGELSIEGHIKAGRIIKATICSVFSKPLVYTRMDLLRYDLENWMSLEIGHGQLDGPEFYDVYYRWTDQDQSFHETLRSADEVIAALRDLEQNLKVAYPDCAPLRKQLRRVEMSILLLEKTR